MLNSLILIVRIPCDFRFWNSLQFSENYEIGIFLRIECSPNEIYSAKMHRSSGVLIAYKIFVKSCSLSDRFQPHKLLTTFILTQMDIFIIFMSTTGPDGQKGPVWL